ncbi:MAG: hypothetical protein ACI8X5_002891 [Planctomycetota bacterium]|jgi:hypothetical protein
MRATTASITFASITLLGLCSCRAERHLIFVTEPPGAQVRIDGELAGRTPLDLRFDDYGHRHISIQRHGYRSYTEVMEVEPPWFYYFPLDYITEVLLPFGWEDTHQLNVVLEPQSGEISKPDFDKVLEHAESLRRAGPAGPVRPSQDLPKPAAQSESDQ